MDDKRGFWQKIFHQYFYNADNKICQPRMLTECTDYDIRTFMNTISVSVTDFRDNLADYLNAVRFENQRVVVKKNRNIMAELVPSKSAQNQIKKQTRRRVLPEAFGMWKNRKEWKGLSTIEIADRLREQAWKGSYDD